MPAALRLLAAPAAALGLFAALTPLLAAIILGAHGLAALALTPDWAAATARSLMLAEATVLIAWPAGALAALALWGAPAWPRRCVLAAATLCLLLPPGWTAHGLGLAARHTNHLAALLLGHAAPAAAAVTLVLTACLNRLDPALLRTAAASGAAPGRAWRLALGRTWPWPLLVSVAAACTLGLADPTLDARLEIGGHVSLDALAMRQPDAAACLMAGVLVLCPVVVAGIAGMLRRRG